MKPPSYQYPQLDIPAWLRLLITHKNTAILDVPPVLQEKGFPARVVALHDNAGPFSVLTPIGEFPPNAEQLAIEWAQGVTSRSQMQVRDILQSMGLAPAHDPKTCPRCSRGEIVH